MGDKGGRFREFETSLAYIETSRPPRTTYTRLLRKRRKNFKM